MKNKMPTYEVIVKITIPAVSLLKASELINHWFEVAENNIELPHEAVGKIMEVRVVNEYQ